MERPLGPGVRKKGRNTYQVSVENYKKDKERLGPEKFEKLKKESQKQKFLTGGQAKLAAKAPPPNKLDEKDFAVLREEKAKGRGMGLQDEKVKTGKVKPVKAVLGLAAMGLMGAKYLKDKNKKATPMIGAAAELMKKKKELLGKKMGGVMKYKRGSGLDLPVISSVKPAVHKTKRAQNLSKMKIQFNKQRSRMGDFAKKKGLPKPLNTSANFKGVGKFPYVSMAEMRKAKGFKPGESATDFNKRRMALEVGKKALKATTVGKIALGVGAAGVAAQQYLKSKMKKKDEPKKKMGGGMMMKYSKGGGADTGKQGEMKSKIAVGTMRVNKILGRLKGRDRLTQRDIEAGKELLNQKKFTKRMGGGMMQKPMGYSKGVSVKARGCKLGRTRPTKIT